MYNSERSILNRELKLVEAFKPDLLSCKTVSEGVCKLDEIICFLQLRVALTPEPPPQEVQPPISLCPST